MRDLLSNMSNCYVRAGKFRVGSLEYKYRVIFVLVLGVILYSAKCSWIIMSNNVLIVRLIGQTSGQSPRQII